MDDSSAKSVSFGSIVVGISSTESSLVLQDGSSQLHWESRVHSGDYFTTLATELENLMEETNDSATQMKFQALIDELEYIQQRYELVQKQVQR